jgi:hypothetical protein
MQRMLLGGRSCSSQREVLSWEDMLHSYKMITIVKNCTARVDRMAVEPAKAQTYERWRENGVTAGSCN